MNCLEFRRLLGADPASRNAAFIAHRDSCRTCAGAWQHAQHFEQTLQQTLAVGVPEGLVERALLAHAIGVRQQRRRRRRFALGLAASLLVVLAGGGLVWRHATQQAQQAQRQLAAFAVAHMPPEMASLRLTRPVAHAMIVADFADRGLSLPGPIPADTTYVHRCIIGPYKGVHLVTRADGAPVVVLYLPHKQLSGEHHFTRDGWHGMEVPLRHGSMVVMTNHDNAQPLVSVAQAWKHAIEGQAPGHRLATLYAPTHQPLHPSPRRS